MNKRPLKYFVIKNRHAYLALMRQLNKRLVERVVTRRLMKLLVIAKLNVSFSYWNLRRQMSGKSLLRKLKLVTILKLRVS